ncbi:MULTISPECIES: YihY/virulence factor BrkB family protein [Streptomyces]|nr:YihY/virulence factor BrkB family protein [Streptomyces sp. SCSIO ZS0520]AYN32275.1 YihY/virulence factor BrkB family protein [Streptomyces albus]
MSPAHAEGEGPRERAREERVRAREEADGPGADEQKRSGRSPQGPPHKRRGGLGATLKRTLAEFKEDNLADSAAALTYYAVLSIFPALIALVALVSVVMDPKTLVEKATDLISKVGPDSAVNTFKGPIDQLANGGSTGPVLLIVGLVSALWTASGYIGAFMRAANRIYEVEEGRPFLKLRPLQMLVTLVLVLLQALVLVALVVSGPLAEEVGSTVGAGDAAVTAWNWAKWPVLLLVVVLMFALLYYAAPNARLRGLKSVVPGAVLALVLWLIASVGFAFYAAHFGSYNKTYGALGGVIVFLVWLWITNLAVLLGAEFNAERERSRELAEGTPGAEREIQVPERTAPKREKRSRTA